MLMQGRLGGTGKMIILPVDQGFEHGPARSFAANPAAYDPHYHYQIAIDAGLNAYAAPLGMIEAGADTFAGQIPTILKVNSSNSLVPARRRTTRRSPASVDDALRLGCAAIGFTIYPGSSEGLDMFEEISEMREEAAAKGVATVIWSYPRGEDLSKAGETAIDVGAYATQIAALLGAHIIKVKLSTDHLEQAEAKKVYEKQAIDISTGAARVGTACRRRSAAGGSSSSPAARPREPTRSTTTPGRSATAAATARSSGATPSSARARMRWRCSTSWSTSTRDGAETGRARGIPFRSEFCHDPPWQRNGHEWLLCTWVPSRGAAASAALFSRSSSSR